MAYLVAAGVIVNENRWPRCSAPCKERICQLAAPFASDKLDLDAHRGAIAADPPQAVLELRPLDPASPAPKARPVDLSPTSPKQPAQSLTSRGKPLPPKSAGPSPNGWLGCQKNPGRLIAFRASEGTEYGNWILTHRRLEPCCGDAPFAACQPFFAAQARVAILACGSCGLLVANPVIREHIGHLGL